MSVLVLSPYPEKLTNILRDNGEDIVVYNDPITTTTPNPNNFSLAVSYGYRHLIPPDVLDLWLDRIINLHISLLPWNRGADPNFWSAYEGTPSGVSIHHINSGIDTGDIIAQTKVELSPNDTLSSSYERLHVQILQLFSEIWPQICAGTAPRIVQTVTGSYHNSNEKTDLIAKLPLKWNTPISDVAMLAKREIQK